MTPGVRDQAPSVGAVDDAAWDAYVAGHPDRCAYHYAGWARVVSVAFAHEAVMLAATTDTRVVGVLPLIVMRSRLFGRFVVSLPYLNEGGVLADDAIAESALIEKAVEISRDAAADYLELRHTRRHSMNLTDRQHKVAMTLALAESPDRQWQALDRKVRNQVRKGERSGLEVVSGGEELIGSFYEVFARNMRDLGTPVFGVRIFDEALRAFPQHCRVFCARHEGSTVAAAIVHWRGDSLEVIWASALRESNRLSANVFLYWHLVQFAIAQKCTRFEFGRCTPGEGPFQFKRQWGAEPRPLVWEYWHANSSVDHDKSPRNPKYRAAVALWQRLPLGITTMVGPRIVRNIPC